MDNSPDISPLQNAGVSSAASGRRPPDAAPNRATHPVFAQALRFWLKLGFISFGGPTGQIAIMHTELVEKRRWISESRFLHALNYCMLLPGPEAQQLATYIGWLLHGAWGGIVAGSLFVLPSIAILWGLSYVYVAHGSVPWIAAVFYGLKPAVVAIVAVAVIRIGRRALKNKIMWIIAGSAFVAIYFLALPFPAIIVSAGLIGLAGARFAPTRFIVLKPHAPDSNSQAAVIDDSHGAPDHARPTLARGIRVLAACLLLWWTPVVAVGFWLGAQHTLFREGVFFSKAAMVTFGGAYAVLPYVAQRAVEYYSWLEPTQMLDGLGLAETTPGPLIMVVQFVGFMGGWNHPGALPPLLAASLGALLTTWVTFVPCFLWIFLGAPYIETMRTNKRMSAALSTITAAVVGVVLNLAVWFAIHVVRPSAGNVDWAAAGMALGAFVIMLRWKVDIVRVIGLAAAAGLVHFWFTTP